MEEPTQQNPLPAEAAGVPEPKPSLELPQLAGQTGQTLAIAPPEPPPEDPTPSPRRFSPLKFGLGLLLNLLGLGCAAAGGGLGGVAIASAFPAPRSEQPPWLETGLRQGGALVQSAQRLPKALVTGLANQLDPPPQPQLDAAAPILTETQRQQIGDEVAALQNELNQVDGRAALLEQQLGYQYPDGDLALRLEALAQTVANPTAGPGSVVNRDRDRQPLRVTLPLDPLFDDAQSTLKPASTALLGAIVAELRAYPKGVVTIGSHSDDVGAGPAKRDLSLRRAQAVAAYLQNQVGDTPRPRRSNRFLWNVVGFGDSEPLVPNDSNENRQRNRRLEIQVTPR